VVYAVEAETVAFGTELSAAVAAALPELVAAVLAELSGGLSAHRRPEHP
jgi:hypothetical protein